MLLVIGLSFVVVLSIMVGIDAIDFSSVNISSSVFLLIEVISCAVCVFLSEKFVASFVSLSVKIISDDCSVKIFTCVSFFIFSVDILSDIFSGFIVFDDTIWEVSSDFICDSEALLVNISSMCDFFIWVFSSVNNSSVVEVKVSFILSELILSDILLVVFSSIPLIVDNFSENISSVSVFPEIIFVFILSVLIVDIFSSKDLSVILLLCVCSILVSSDNIICSVI